jgi:tripartite-type tricarboxylate transporter receptor subunit TctC
VRIIVGAAPGGGYDITARLMSPFLSERLGRPFIVENRPGTATIIGTEAVVKAPPDGYTLLRSGRNHCAALRQTQFRPDSRHRADRGHQP